MSLTLLEARARAAALSEVAYALDLDLRDHEGGTFGLRCEVSFACSAEATFLELTGARDLHVELDGVEVDAAYDGTRLHLVGLGGRHRAVVTARVPYVTDGDGMHVFTDPADGATYASAYLGMDVAQRVFPCFDQNDLKAPVRLSVTADPTWTVVANGRVESHDEAGRWGFATTLPIPTAMFVVCAGPWHSRTWEHAGLPFAWHARASLAAELDRDFEELRTTTEQCFDHYATLFTEPMPFDSYEQAFVPGQNWGALETPGCVTYRDEYLPRGRLTGQLRAARASTIAHEMAHMWFGDLVTMTWWEDTWLQESFADYMGTRVATDAVGHHGLLVAFESARKVNAYRADARRSTHPVAPEARDVPDVDAAASNFDMISYAKGGSSLRQLVTWLGDETFLAGVNAYLSEHRLGNATLADFVAALDAASDRDARGWADAWLRTTGFDTVRVERDADGTPVLHREGSRPHRFWVAAYDDALAVAGGRLVDLGAEPVALPDMRGLVVLPNARSETYAQVSLDDLSLAAFADRLPQLEDPLARAVVWGQWFESVRTRRLAPLDYLGLVARHLPVETVPVIVGSVVSRTVASVLPERVAAADVGDAVRRLAEAFTAGLAVAGASGDDELRLAFVEALASTSRDAALLESWLDADGVDGLTWYAGLRWRVVARLAALGAADAACIEGERRRDGTIDGEIGAARALASRPTREAKAAAWTAATEPDVSNRRFEALVGGLWQSEQAALVAPYVQRYLAQAPELAERGQAFSRAVGKAFPAVPLDEEQLAAVRVALSGVDHTILARDWQDALDDRI